MSEPISYRCSSLIISWRGTQVLYRQRAVGQDAVLSEPCALRIASRYLALSARKPVTGMADDRMQGGSPMSDKIRRARGVDGDRDQEREMEERQLLLDLAEAKLLSWVRFRETRERRGREPRRSAALLRQCLRQQWASSPLPSDGQKRLWCSTSSRENAFSAFQLFPV